MDTCVMAFDLLDGGGNVRERECLWIRRQI
jgi:hypothetical protein